MTLSFKTDVQPISMACAGGGAQIEAIREELTAWSAGKSPRVQAAIRNLDGWLAAAVRGPDHDHPEVVVVACLQSAIETLRRATGRA